MTLNRYLIYIRNRHPFLGRGKMTISIIIMVFTFILVIFLHFLLLPKICGAYNDECYLNKEKYSDLLYAVQTIGKTLEKHNITYWLDYGTLLGAIRYGDIIPWDGDADISFLLDDEKYSFHDELIRKYGISSNGLMAQYKQTSIDYARWRKQRGFYNRKEVTLLHKHYPKSILKNELAVVKYDRLSQTIPLSWIVPTKKVEFRGVKLRIPNEHHKVLANRYSFTYFSGLSVPYKWKCWVPCWIRTAPGC